MLEMASSPDLKKHQVETGMRQDSSTLTTAKLETEKRLLHHIRKFPNLQDILFLKLSSIFGTLPGHACSLLLSVAAAGWLWT